MNIEDLIHGESKNIEYKEMLPSNSDKYTKTVVAFANTQGGKMEQMKLSALIIQFFFR